MSKLTEQWLEIFRAGDYGAKGNYSEQDLAQLAADFKPAMSVPAVIGHPQQNAPAVGWVGQVIQRGRTLLAKLRDVAPDFERLAREGRFKKRSVALTRGADGKLQLRHVGFLGAMAPDVKGLADAQFSAAPLAVIDLDEEVHFNEAPGTGIMVDPVSASFARAAQKRASEQGIEFGQAMRELRAEGVADRSPQPALAVDPASATFAETAAKRAAERQITFGDAMRELRAEEHGIQYTEGHIPVDPVSVTFAEAARERAAERHITFGDAMRDLRAEGVADRSHQSGLAIDPASVTFAEAASARSIARHIELGDAMRQLRSENFSAASSASDLDRSTRAAQFEKAIKLRAALKAISEHEAIDELEKEGWRLSALVGWVPPGANLAAMEEARRKEIRALAS